MSSALANKRSETIRDQASARRKKKVSRILKKITESRERRKEDRESTDVVPPEWLRPSRRVSAQPMDRQRQQGRLVGTKRFCQRKLEEEYSGKVDSKTMEDYGQRFVKVVEKYTLEDESQEFDSAREGVLSAYDSVERQLKRHMKTIYHNAESSIEMSQEAQGR